MTASSDLKAQSLCLTAQTFRWTFPPEATARQRGALQARFNAILGHLGISDREERLRVASALVGRRVTSFNDLFGGEIRALLDEPDLEEIVRHLVNGSSHTQPSE